VASVVLSCLAWGRKSVCRFKQCQWSAWFILCFHWTSMGSIFFFSFAADIFL